MSPTNIEQMISAARPQPSGCFFFGNPEAKNPYGTVTLGGRTENAHRAAWKLAFGEIPDGLQVLHKCDNPSCIRPDHLFLGTQLDNVRDCVAKGRKNFVVGEDSHLAKLTESQALEIIRLNAGGFSATELAGMFGINRQHCNDIITGRRWRHLHKRIERIERLVA